MEQINHSFVVVLLNKIGCVYCERIKIILPLHRKLLREKYPTLDVTILQFDNEYNVVSPHPFTDNTILKKLDNLWIPLFFFCPISIWQKMVQQQGSDITWKWSDIYIFDTEWDNSTNSWTKLNYNSVYDPHHVFNWVVNCDQRNQNLIMDNVVPIKKEDIPDLATLLPNFLTTIDKVCTASTKRSHDTDNVCYADLHCRWKKDTIYHMNKAVKSHKEND